MGMLGGATIGGVAGQAGGIRRIFGRTAPIIEAEAGDYQAELVTADGPLGAVQAQEALDLIAAAGPFYTTEQLDGVVLSSSPGWTVIKTFAIDVSTTRFLRAQLEIAGGTAATPTGATIDFRSLARRTSGGVVSVGSGVSTTDSIGISPTLSWVVSGTAAALRARATGGPTVDITLRYSWLEKTPP